MNPEDLLNAAGRAGRAGESATGIVLVIPGKVVGLNNTENSIGSHWPRLRDIFGQSDQCLVLDDPFTALMDRIHDQSIEPGDLEKYVVARLAETSEIEGGSKEVRLGLARSFAAFRKKQANDEAWVTSRTASALALLNNGDASSAIERQPFRDLASMLGMPEDILAKLADDIIKIGFDANKTINEWCEWMFNWLETHPDDVFRLLKIETIEYLFGASFKNLQSNIDRAAFTLPPLKKALEKWMNGDPLIDIQKALSTAPRDIKYSTSARKFVIRLVSDIAHVLSAPLQIFLRIVNAEKDESIKPRPELAYLNQCVRKGFISEEMAFYALQMRSAKWGRRETHRNFEQIIPYLKPEPPNETLDSMKDRVQDAMNAELNSRN